MSTGAAGMPNAETTITEPLIAGLIADQIPSLAGLPIQIVGEGWDNVMARIGDRFAVRMPRHAVGERLLKVEQRWLPDNAPRLPLPVPVPLETGAPGREYPFTWSLVH